MCNFASQHCKKIPPTKRSLNRHLQFASLGQIDNIYREKILFFIKDYLETFPKISLLC